MMLAEPCVQLYKWVLKNSPSLCRKSLFWTAKRKKKVPHAVMVNPLWMVFKIIEINVVSPVAVYYILTENISFLQYLTKVNVIR